MAKRAAVWCATRNLYADTLPSVKSFFANGGLERAYLLIEDDVFPYELPGCVETINVSDQPWFGAMGPNYSKRWTWMVLMRAALALVFPSFDRIVSLDADTICVGDAGGLWDISLDGWYMAAVKEPECSAGGTFEKAEKYFNCGVTVQNLEALRDGTVQKLIKALNEKDYAYCEQDAMNEILAGKIREISAAYNGSEWTPCSDPVIWHFAGDPNWRDKAIVSRYRDMSWEEALKERL